MTVIFSSNRYTANYSTEVFKIISVNVIDPETYQLVDYQNNKIKGKFIKICSFQLNYKFINLRMFLCK